MRSGPRIRLVRQGRECPPRRRRIARREGALGDDRPPPELIHGSRAEYHQLPRRPGDFLRQSGQLGLADELPQVRAAPVSSHLPRQASRRLRPPQSQSEKTARRLRRPGSLQRVEQTIEGIVPVGRARDVVDDGLDRRLVPGQNEDPYVDGLVETPGREQQVRPTQPNLQAVHAPTRRLTELPFRRIGIAGGDQGLGERQNRPRLGRRRFDPPASHRPGRVGHPGIDQPADPRLPQPNGRGLGLDRLFGPREELVEMPVFPRHAA